MPPKTESKTQSPKEKRDERKALLIRLGWSMPATTNYSAEGAHYGALKDGKPIRFQPSFQKFVEKCEEDKDLSDIAELFKKTLDTCGLPWTLDISERKGKTWFKAFVSAMFAMKLADQKDSAIQDGWYKREKEVKDIVQVSIQDWTKRHEDLFADVAALYNEDEKDPIQANMI